MRIAAALCLWLALLAGAAGAQETAAGWLGVHLEDLTKEEADSLGWEAPRGAKVVKLVPGGPVEKAGLLVGDIVWSLDGVEVANTKALIEAIKKKAAGAAVRLAFQRNMREKRLTVTLGILPAEYGTVVPKATPDAAFPMLDTGGHTAYVRAMTFTPDGQQLVSASEDMTIRVWDVASGKTVRIIRGQAFEDTGQIYSMALTPDGKWLAASGWLTQFNGSNLEDVFAIRLYDFASGKLTAVLKGHVDAVYTLVFSPDGRYLLSGSHDKSAIIWDVAAAKEMQRLKGHTSGIAEVSFTPDGARAVTGSTDKDLRLWRVADGALLAVMSGHKEGGVRFAVAADGRIASGDDSGEIRLWDGQTGQLLTAVARPGKGIVRLAFAQNGKLLLTAGRSCYIHDLDSGQETVIYRGEGTIGLAIAIAPGGRWVATGGGDNNEIQIWDLQTGKRRTDAAGQPLTLGGKGLRVPAVGFNADGRQIGWGNGFHSNLAVNDYGIIEYALTLPSASAPFTAPQTSGGASFLRSTVQLNGWSLERRKGGKHDSYALLDIKKDGELAATIERDSRTGYEHRSYTFSPDGETIVSGGINGWLFAYDRAGQQIGVYTGHEGHVWSVASSPDGRYLLSSADDQTVRLWNLKTRELLATLFRANDGEWVMWTPQGYFVSSGPGADLIGWQINHGLDHEADYVTAAQVRRHFNRPDIVARTIELASGQAAVKEAHAEFRLEDLLSKPVPRLRILSPTPETLEHGGTAQVRVELGETPDPIKLIRIHVNGRLVAEKIPEEGAGFPPGQQTFTVPLAKGANKIAIVAANETGETTASLNVTHDSDGALDKRGTLYIVAIGVDEYNGLGDVCGSGGNQSCNLRYAGTDAKGFASAMERNAGPVHEKVVKRVLVNGAALGDVPTATNIIDALALLHDARENDTVMLFISGHGINEGPNYRFLATDSTWGTGRLLRQSSIVPWYAFQEVLTASRGRRILFLDTCHAANAFNQKLLSDSYQSNIVVYSAARWDQEALENSALGNGHGLFTYALIEGMDGRARNVVGEVRTDSLWDFVRERVGALAQQLKHTQEPQYFKGRDTDNFLLAR